MVEYLCGGRVAGDKDLSRSFEVRAHQNESIKIFGIDHGTRIHQKGQNRANRPRSSRWLELRDQNVVSTVQQSECLQKLKSCSLTSERSGGVLHVSWTCSQPCGARGAAVHASGAMRSDTPGGHQPESDWLLSSINSPRPLLISSHPDLSKAISKHQFRWEESQRGYRGREKQSGRLRVKSILTEKASSVQSAILYDCDAEPLSKSFRPGQSVPLMIKWRYCPELFQFHGFRSVEVLLDTPPGSPKNCSGAKGGSVQVEISSVQSSKSSLGFWPSPLRSTSCFSPRTLSWSNFCDSDRIVPNLSRSASGPWCWVGRSVMFLFDCWLAGRFRGVTDTLPLVLLAPPNPTPCHIQTDKE
ncbi:hypothetical protein F2Q68_00045354 [Brassica cretica]|uniref:Uncharacterized protein n=1 Tax=Brassica cretica TaxID=69181 RepID=A0A8S9LSJ1_BRACR|nr:hypothetical protein F2Q68_00045354 [Brassica cretica]